MLIKLEWLGYCMVKKLPQNVKPFSSNTGTSRTDRQTEFLYQDRASVCWRAIKTDPWSTSESTTKIILDPYADQHQKLSLIHMRINTKNYPWSTCGSTQKLSLIDMRINTKNYPWSTCGSTPKIILDPHADQHQKLSLIDMRINTKNYPWSTCGSTPKMNHF